MIKLNILVSNEYRKYLNLSGQLENSINFSSKNDQRHFFINLATVMLLTYDFILPFPLPSESKECTTNGLSLDKNYTFLKKQIPISVLMSSVASKIAISILQAFACHLRFGDDTQ